jgi:hypothetical protein
MSHHTQAEVVKIVTVNPETGAEVAGTTYYGVAAGDDEGYGITRSAESLEALRAEIGDLTDAGALAAHAVTHYPEHLAGLE